MKDLEKSWTPEEILQVSGGYWEGFALHAAVNLDLFTHMGKGPLGLEDLAREVGAEASSLGRLMDALCAMELVEAEGDAYRNTPAASTFLSQDSPAYLGHIIQHHHHLVGAWVRLEEAVRTGKPVREEAAHDEARRGAFLMGMHNIASAQAPRVAEALDLAGRHHLLDLGGGPGTYAVHFCLRYPALAATVYDLPTTRPYAEKVISEAGLSGRIGFEAGDFLKDPIPGNYDVVWLSQVLHSLGPEECGELLARGAAVLDPGGILVVHEFLLDDTGKGPLFPALFSLNMLVNTPRGRAYREGEVRGMLAEVGLESVTRLPFRGSNNSGIVMGTKRGLRPPGPPLHRSP